MSDRTATWSGGCRQDRAHAISDRSEERVAHCFAAGWIELGVLGRDLADTSPERAAPLLTSARGVVRVTPGVLVEGIDVSGVEPDGSGGIVCPRFVRRETPEEQQRRVNAPVK